MTGFDPISLRLSLTIVVNVQAFSLIDMVFFFGNNLQCAKGDLRNLVGKLRV